jgi:RNA polymerase sigma-70 factor (ECF subfamily)
MDEHDLLAERFEAHRARLRAVAYRMLGSSSEADDAIQEAWLRLSRVDADEVDNLGAWLTTVVARVCLNMLQSRRSKREEPLDGVAESGDRADEGLSNPEDEAVLADSVGLALLVVLDTLTPAERLAFVLHDLFAMPFDEIAPIVDRSPEATRQLASRARRRVQGAEPDAEVDLPRRREIVDAFLAASREGNFEALLATLDPDAVVRADAVTVAMGGGQAEVRGSRAVAEAFVGRARAARSALVNGAPGAVWSVGGRPKVVFDFTIADGRIVAIDLIADPDTIGGLQLVMGGRVGPRLP